MNIYFGVGCGNCGYGCGSNYYGGYPGYYSGYYPGYYSWYSPWYGDPYWYYGMDLLILATAGMAGGDTALGAGVGAQLGTTIAIPTMLGTMVIARDL